MVVPALPQPVSNAAFTKFCKFLSREIFLISILKNAF